jgi:dihydroflavonol-4-reductase
MPWVVALAAGAASSGWAQISGKPPRVPLDAVRMAHRKMFVTHEKASRELGFSPVAVDGALERAVIWFRDNGYV